MRANLVWDRLVRGRFSGSVTVSDDDVDAYLQRITENADKPERRIAEIFLAVDNPEEDAAVARQARTLYQQLKQGANFPEMARQFSQAARATSPSPSELQFCCLGCLVCLLDLVREEC